MKVEWNMNMGVLGVSLLGSSIIGGFTGWWSVNIKQHVQENTIQHIKEDVEKSKKDIEEIKESVTIQETRQEMILKELQRIR